MYTGNPIQLSAGKDVSGSTQLYETLGDKVKAGAVLALKLKGRVEGEERPWLWAAENSSWLV